MGTLHVAAGAASPGDRPRSAPLVQLIGGPSISCDDQIREVPEGGKRLLAFVALRQGRIERSYAAGTLWPSGDDVRAAGNLRSALWRLRRGVGDVIWADKWSLRLAEGIRVDVHEVAGWAERMIHGTAAGEDLDLRRVPVNSCELLPGWYDDWVIIEREQLRQRVLHGLEATAHLLIEQGRCPEAVDAALRAVREEPLRETAQYALVAAQLAQGNLAEARLVYTAFAGLLQRELGVQPSGRLTALIAAAGRDPAARTGLLTVDTHQLTQPFQRLAAELTA